MENTLSRPNNFLTQSASIFLFMLLSQNGNARVHKMSFRPDCIEDERSDFHHSRHSTASFRGPDFLFRDIIGLFFVHNIMPSMNVRGMAYIPTITISNHPRNDHIEQYKLFVDDTPEVRRKQMRQLITNTRHYSPHVRKFAGSFGIFHEHHVHAVCYILDVYEKTVEVFDPCGDKYKTTVGQTIRDMRNMLVDDLQQVHTSYELLEYQKNGRIVSQKNLMGVPSACALWTLLYMWLRASNSLPIIISLFDNIDAHALGVTSLRLGIGLRILFKKAVKVGSKPEFFQEFYLSDPKPSRKSIHKQDVLGLLMEALPVRIDKAEICQRIKLIMEPILEQTLSK